LDVLRGLSIDGGMNYDVLQHKPCTLKRLPLHHALAGPIPVTPTKYFTKKRFFQKLLGRFSSYFGDLISHAYSL
jgi:hypothetical protein